MTRHRILPAIAIAWAAAVAGAVAQDRPAAALESKPVYAQGQRGAVAAGGQASVDAGLEILHAGGNAADAAAATLLALSVTDSSAFCFGGEVPLIYYDARRGRVEVLAGLGVAPALATREFFAARGGIPGEGLEPAAVPAVVDLVVTLLDRHVTRSFAAAAAPMLRLLDRREQPWHADLARTVRELAAAESAAAARGRNGLVAVSDCFYRGPIARRLADWCQAHGGLIRYHDLARHVTRIEQPAAVDYRGHTVLKCGVWTQGPYLLQTLQLLAGFDLKSLGHNSPAAVHHTIEAMKLALADRDVYYADPLWADVPLAELLAPDYARLRRALIDPARASLAMRPGEPRRMQALLDEPAVRRGLGGPAHDTTTCLVADGQGNVVAATPSGWSGVVAGDTGVWLGTRLQSFNLWPDHPNCIAPGKRPRITLTPTLVLRQGKPAIAVSVAGGDGQDQASLQVLLNLIDFGLAPPEAVSAARFGTAHHLGSFRQTPPELGSLSLYNTFDPATVEKLRSLGHRVRLVPPPLWAPSLITIDAATFHATGDPLAGRQAGAF